MRDGSFAAVVNGPGDMEVVKEVATPKIESGEVLVEVGPKKSAPWP